jgi:ComF family protein
MPLPSLTSATETMLGLVEPVLAVVFPSSCPGCAETLAHPTRGPLCEGCWNALPRHSGRGCGCGLPLPPGLVVCGRCRRGRQPFAAGWSLGPYEGSLRTLVHELKYRGKLRVAERLAEALVAQPGALHLLRGSDVLVPVPLHPRRRRERGFNQAEVLAQALARRAGRPCAPAALVRRKDTCPQAGLSAAERRRNVQDAFAVRGRPQIAGRVVTVVDDVLTTGATAQACARALLAAGAAEVRLLAVARVS